jgi:hypothetical protein
MQATIDRLSLFHLSSRRFNLDVAAAPARVAGEPWAWCERTAQGCTYGRIGRIEFSWQWGH